MREIWVRSNLTLDGDYVVTVELDEDTTITLNRADATAYANYVLEAAERASYDAAVYHQ